jgi:hypothetical protein
MGAGSLALACLLLLGQVSSDIFYTNQQNHRLNVDFSKAQRAAIKEVRLFASSNQGRSWDLVSTIQPEKGFFVFNAPGDGIYWLRVASVNQQDVQEPPNMQVGQPDQKMVIDTVKPVVRSLQGRRQGGEVVVSWEIQEDHPDVDSFRIEFQPKDASSGLWTAVQAKAGPSGQARFQPGSGQAMVVRLSMRDLAGNQSFAIAEVAGESIAPAGFNGAGGATQAGGANVPPAAGTLEISKEIPVPLAQQVNPPPSQGAPPTNLAPQGLAAVGKPQGPEALPSAFPVKPPAALGDSGLSTANSSPAPLGMNPGALPAAAPPKEERKLIASSKWTPSTTPAVPPAAAPGAGDPRPPAASPRKQLPALQHINQLEFMVEYEVSKVGPSGVGSVMLYWTRDDGQTWKEYAYDEKIENPTKGTRLQRMVRFQEGEPDGIYGFTLVVKNRANIGRQAPQAGEVPELRVELDTRAPDADLYEPTRDPQAGHLLLRWDATDKNLTSTPINLEWAETRDGPWRPIGVDLPNNGHFSWKLPEQMPVAVFLRLRVRDQAGNETVAISPTAQPVDLHEPEGHLLRVSMPARQP